MSPITISQVWGPDDFAELLAEALKHDPADVTLVEL